MRQQLSDMPQPWVVVNCFAIVQQTLPRALALHARIATSEDCGPSARTGIVTPRTVPHDDQAGQVVAGAHKGLYAVGIHFHTSLVVRGWQDMELMSQLTHEKKVV